jgi:hypothetical protein
MEHEGDQGCSVLAQLEVTEGKVGHGNKTGEGRGGSFSYSEKTSFRVRKAAERTAPHPIS